MAGGFYLFSFHNQFLSEAENLLDHLKTVSDPRSQDPAGWKLSTTPKPGNGLQQILGVA